MNTGEKTLTIQMIQGQEGSTYEYRGKGTYNTNDTVVMNTGEKTLTIQMIQGQEGSTYEYS